MPSHSATAYFRGVAAIAMFHSDALRALRQRFNDDTLNRVDGVYDLSDPAFHPVEALLFGFTHAGKFKDYNHTAEYPVQIIEVIYASDDI